MMIYKIENIKVLFLNLIIELMASCCLETNNFPEDIKAEWCLYVLIN